MLNSIPGGHFEGGTPIPPKSIPNLGGGIFFSQDG